MPTAEAEIAYTRIEIATLIVRGRTRAASITELLCAAEEVIAAAAAKHAAAIKDLEIVNVVISTTVAILESTGLIMSVENRSIGLLNEMTRRDAGRSTDFG